MQENFCLQCKKLSVGPSNRLVQDSCGHQKCRVCLLEDEEKCKQCESRENEKQKIDSNVSTESVIKFEKNQAPVIMCNGSIQEKVSTKLEVKRDNTDIESAHKVVTTRKDEQNKTSKTKKEKSKAKSKVKKKTDKREYKIVTPPKHITLSLDPSMYHCTICNKTFSSKSHIKYHSYCAGAVKPYKCEICDKEFILRTHLDLHMYKHNGVKLYSCHICHKSFNERSKLKRHSNLHSSVKPFICSECGKSFRSRESLRLHSFIHKNERPFACKLCTARFNNASNLNKHLVSHSKEKVHMCDQCGKRFKLKWALTVHRKSHLRVRSYECTICSKSFINNKDLQRHNLIHLDIKGYSCSICKTSFRRRDNLNRHMKNTHPGKKGEVIKNIAKLISKPQQKLVDNPNAINVITASPAFNKNKETVKSDTRCGTVINGPIKLAFKTPAFKSNYNIHRDFEYIPPPKIQKTYDMVESVNICQKILLPNSDIPTRDATHKKEETTSTEICQKILSPYVKPSIHYETSFQNRTHAMIKNIKFKVPIQYTMESDAKKQGLNDGSTSKADKSRENNISNLYSELKPVQNSPTSVIVNNAFQPCSMHWRRRTSQNLHLKD